MPVSLELLTDEAIIDYSRSDGKDRVLFDHRDLNLKFNTPQPIPGGVYDVDVFGSPIADRCICGKIRQPSSEPCPNCGARVFTMEEGLRRFARIELPFYYLNELRFDIFKATFDDIFSDTKIVLDFAADDLKRGGYSSRGAKKLGIKVFDSCQFDYNPTKKELKISEFITDENKCSYEGLIKIISEHFPDRLTGFMKLINRYYLVLPAMMRPFTVGYKGDKKVMGTHPMSVWYSIVIRLCCVEDKVSNSMNYEDIMNSLETPGERVRYTALLRAFLNTGKTEATELLNTSKKNLARNLYAVRTKNSARCPIVPSVDLAIDEIGVPTHIAYEMMREGFCEYLMSELNFTKKEALKATKLEAFNPETQKLFKEYAENQVVLANRQPSLHEYSMFCLKVRLVDDEYALKFPISICTPLNADFDGDTISIQLVPESAKEDTYRQMSPRYVTFYKKNGAPIPTINHETLNGLAVATEWTPEDPEELKEPRYFYDDYVKLLRDVEVDHIIKVGTPIVFTGKAGTLDYQSKITTYGKIRISKILERDMDDLGFTKDMYTRMDAKAATKLSAYLCDFPEDGIEKRRELQKFCLRVVSLAGVVTFSFDTLFTDTNTETYQKLRKIVDAPDLTDQQKTALITPLYDQYQKEVEATFSDDLKNELNRAGRVKISSISSMNMPQLIISGVDEQPIITHGSLLSGMTEDEYRFHAIENRSLQSIKQSGV